jgi:hypothetical protein
VLQLGIFTTWRFPPPPPDVQQDPLSLHGLEGFAFIHAYQPHPIIPRCPELRTSYPSSLPISSPSLPVSPKAENYPELVLSFSVVAAQRVTTAPLGRGLWSVWSIQSATQNTGLLRCPAWIPISLFLAATPVSGTEPASVVCYAPLPTTGGACDTDRRDGTIEE